MHSIRVPMWQTQSVRPVRTAHISVLLTVNIVSHNPAHSSSDNSLLTSRHTNSKHSQTCYHSLSQQKRLITHSPVQWHGLLGFWDTFALGMWQSQPKSSVKCGFVTRSKYVSSSLLQLLWFNFVTFVCVFNNEKVPHNTFCVHLN